MALNQNSERERTPEGEKEQRLVLSDAVEPFRGAGRGCDERVGDYERAGLARHGGDQPV